MCGIIGIIGRDNAATSLVESLKLLEYRGYDSAGIATLDNGAIACVRAKGKLAALEEALATSHAPGSIGIGHTRWATHGVPNETNAHPHVTHNVAVVHNGIIENYQALREELSTRGAVFKSQTDTEVVPHLIEHYLAEGHAPLEAFSLSLKRLEGAFALVVLIKGEDRLLIAKQGSPLVIGYGDNEMFVGSDAYALAPFTRKIAYLEDGDSAEVQKDSATIYHNNAIVQRTVKTTNLPGGAVGKGNFRHFMLKEIFEQPSAVENTFRSFFHGKQGHVEIAEFPFDPASISRISIIACGTSYYAGLVAKYWLESLAGIPVDIDVASEFRYRNIVFPENGVALCISQSGETADTLAALKYAKEHNQRIISVVNAAESSMAHLSDLVIPTLAGPEIGVASTKAFTTQLMALAGLCLFFAQERKALKPAQLTEATQALMEVPGRIAHILNQEEQIASMAKELVNAQTVLYVGRNTSYAVALEGALKLKELSYIHAEGVAAGELKHGPIALIDNTVPVIAIAPSDNLLEKTASNMEEIAARGGKLFLFSDKQGIARANHVAYQSFEVPAASAFVAPLLYVVPVQLLAYHIAVLKGTDVDQPRNLAKSVTVE